jgi:uncharacterized protein (DUF302 family)
MNRKLIGVALTLVFAIAALAASATAQNARVTVPSQQNFDQTVSHLKSAVGQGGMMIMATVDQGNMLSMTGLKLKATLFLVGNPTVGKKVFEQNHGAGLYMPLRVYVYEDKDGRTYVSYDKPSSLLAQFDNQEINQTATMLDQKLEGLAHMVTQ